MLQERDNVGYVRPFNSTLLPGAPTGAAEVSKLEGLDGRQHQHGLLGVAGKVTVAARGLAQTIDRQDLRAPFWRVS